MKKLKYLFPMWVMSAGMLLHSTVAFASSAGSSNGAVVDILNNPRYEGAIDSIQWLTEIVDTGFTMFITFIAFFIISAAMLRNVLAGCYCAFPKFWDKVDAAHKEVQDTGWVTRIKGLATSYQNINAGSVGKALMRILPNIKALTDFEDASIEPKSYFIKAIPQMIGVIIIGAFIYNGYYRDTASVVTNFGSEMFNRVMLSADPVAIYDRISGATGKPEFSTDSAQDDMGKLINKISEKAYSKVISTYSDIKGAANKSALASQLEQWVKSEVTTKATKYASDADSWKYSYDVTLTVGGTTQDPVATESADGLSASVVFTSLPVSELNLDSTKQVGVDWNINVVINFKKKASITKHKRVNDLSMKLTTKMVKATKSGTTTYTLALPVAETSAALIAYESTTIGNYPATVNNGSLVVKASKLDAGTVYDAVGLWYKDGAGTVHKVTKLTITSGTTAKATFTSSTYSKVNISFGDTIDASMLNKDN